MSDLAPGERWLNTTQLDEATAHVQAAGRVLAERAALGHADARLTLDALTLLMVESMWAASSQRFDEIRAETARLLTPYLL